MEDTRTEAEQTTDTAAPPPPETGEAPPVAEDGSATVQPDDATAESNDAPAAETPADEAAASTETPVGSDGAQDLAEPGVDPHVWAMILEARKEERAAEQDVEALAEELKDAKKRHEKASDRLGRLIDEAKFPTLFSGRKQEQPGATTTAETTSADAAALPTASPPPEAWRAVKIEDLEPKLKPGKLKALAEHNPPILTMGEMADWQASKGDFWVKDIKGFGETGAEQYQAAADRYWAEHPQQPAATPAGLVWQDHPSGEDGVFAENTAGLVTEDGLPFAFYAEPHNGGEVWHVTGDPEITGGGVPNPFKDLDDAKAWCGIRNAELAARNEATAPPADNPAESPAGGENEPTADFDDDALGQTESVINLPKTLVIEVARRAGGRWAVSWFAGVGSNLHSTKLDGHHASSAAAVTVAAEEVRAWLGKLSLSGKAVKRREEIERALAKLERELVHEPAEQETVGAA